MTFAPPPKRRPASKGALDKLMSGSQERARILVDDNLRTQAQKLLDDLMRNADGIGEHVTNWMESNKRDIVESLGLDKIVPVIEGRLDEELSRHDKLTTENASRILNKAVEDMAADMDARIQAIEAKHGKRLVITRPDLTTTTITNPHKLMPELLRHIGVRLDTALIGPSGSGKTTACRQVAGVLDLPFYFIACSDSDMPSKWFGYMNAAGKYVKTQVFEWFTKGGVLLIDEYDNMRDSIGVNLNAMLDNGLGDFPNGLHLRHKDAICVAAGNTVGRGATGMYRARKGLDESTIERFSFIEWGYDPDLELAIVDRTYWVRLVQAARKVVLDKSMAYLVTPRASINGSKLLGTGLTVYETMDRVLFKGWPRDDKAKVMNDNDFRHAFDEATRAHDKELEKGFEE